MVSIDMCFCIGGCHREGSNRNVSIINASVVLIERIKFEMVLIEF